MGFFRDFRRAWSEDTSLSNARAKNRIADFRKEGRKRPRSLMEGMGTPYGRFDLCYGEDDDDE
jgi:hypothetical protein